MPDPQLHFLTIAELAARLESRELSPVEVTRGLLERIEALDARLHSYVTVLGSQALEEAQRAEREIGRGRYRGPLHGIPVAVKDLCETQGVRTTCGTRVLAKWIPERDASVIARLRDSGAVLLGKLAMTEGAYAQHHPEAEAPVHPWEATRWTGVSSSGSGVATAAGLCFGSLGSDTGGSIRVPSACCGVVGLKPTYGRVPLHGIFPLAGSLDHVGPMTRSALDAALMLRVIAGFDARDPESLRAPVPDYAASIEGGIEGSRIGFDAAYARSDVHPEVAAAVDEALQVLESRGAEIVEFQLPELDGVLATWPTVEAAEAALAHAATFPSRAAEYGPELRGFLERGARVSGVEFARARQAQRRFAAELATRFERVDLIACPSFASPAPRVEEFAALEREDMLRGIRLTAPFDWSGSPTISLPCGFSSEGLPVSLQLVARHLEEGLLFRAGHAYQAATDWHARHPPALLGETRS